MRAGLPSDADRYTHETQHNGTGQAAFCTAWRKGLRSRVAFLPISLRRPLRKECRWSERRQQPHRVELANGWHQGRPRWARWSAFSIGDDPCVARVGLHRSAALLSRPGSDSGSEPHLLPSRRWSRQPSWIPSISAP